MKRKTSKAAIAAALASIRETHESLLALEEVVNWMAEIKKADSISLSNVIAAICDDARGHYCDAMDAIAHLKHAAIPFLRKACDALDSAQRIVELAKQDQSLDRADLRAISRVVAYFAGETARWMEQAGEALGDDDPGYGWLDGLVHVAGVPENQFIRLDEQQQWVAQQMGRMGADKRQMLADFIQRQLIAEVNQSINK